MSLFHYFKPNEKSMVFYRPDYNLKTALKVSFADGVKVSISDTESDFRTDKF
jgi:hypothetical protein